MTEVGVAMVMQNAYDQLSDRESYERDLHIASLIEPLGFDRISAVEHHFDNYSMGPDNVAFLCWMAAKTTRLKLLTGAVILPWNEPVRVVERMILLDHLSRGRALFGMGRGLAKREYEAFGIDMNTARERFNESARMITAGLESGFVEGDGPFYKQRRVQIRPGPYKSFKDRTFCVAMSSDSVPVCAELGAVMMVFAQKPWADMQNHFATYRKLFQEYQGRPAPTPTITGFMFCDESADRAEEMANTYIGGYYDIIMHHYEFKGEHFATTKGYGGYAEAAAKARDSGDEEGRRTFAANNEWGTPNQILERYEHRRRMIGEFDLHVNISYAGMPLATAERSMRLFAEKVIPEVKSWKMAA